MPAELFWQSAYLREIFYSYADLLQKFCDLWLFKKVFTFWVYWGYNDAVFVIYQSLIEKGLVVKEE